MGKLKTHTHTQKLALKFSHVHPLLPAPCFAFMPIAPLCTQSHLRAESPLCDSTGVLKATVIAIKLCFGLLVPGSAVVLCFHLLRETEQKTALKVWSGPADLVGNPALTWYRESLDSYTSSSQCPQLQHGEGVSTFLRGVS